MSSGNNSCPFCDASVLSANSTMFVLKDKYPIVKDHVLIIPKRHVMSIFSLYESEWNDSFALLKEMKGRIMREDVAVTGFNIGINDGNDAGQTIAHCHIHLIPRRKGDIDDPLGGVRNIIPSKGRYLNFDKLRILVDEMLDGTDDKLRKLGFEAYSVKKLRRKGVKMESDFSILKYCLSNKMMLITEDEENVKGCQENNIRCVLHGQKTAFEELVLALKTLG